VGDALLGGPTPKAPAGVLRESAPFLLLNPPRKVIEFWMNPLRRKRCKGRERERGMERERERECLRRKTIKE